ncbi:unnamed protein product, partial [Ectocarpus fasciculatus]
MSFSRGALYPSIAVSDAFNVVGHLLAARIAADRGHVFAAAGFLTVAVAGAVGVLRFGFSETDFAAANGALADFAGFVGLPCVGLTFLRRVPTMQLKAADSSIVIMLGCIEAATRGMHPTKREQAKILVNVVFFVAPVVLAAVQNSNFQLLGGIALFVVAGLVITADRHR